MARLTRDELIERVAAALEPKCRAFGRGDMPMQVAREFAIAAIETYEELTLPAKENTHVAAD